MKLVLDTNVIIAAFISHGTCSELFEYCIRNHILITSNFILKEFSDKLITKFKFSHKEVKEALQLVISCMKVVEPIDLGKSICRDPDDDIIISTAVKGQCQCIVTGDKDLLVIGKYNNINIVSPSNFWEFDGHLI